ncbi:hypothetical protein B0H12DRAFT_1079347 [Mycena haematopus]|nr:hypothetical protein B0H12DRAFT_1079347 [Mycena haematopus]
MFLLDFLILTVIPECLESQQNICPRNSIQITTSHCNTSLNRPIRVPEFMEDSLHARELHVLQGHRPENLRNFSFAEACRAVPSAADGSNSQMETAYESIEIRGLGLSGPKSRVFQTPLVTGYHNIIEY